MEQDKKPTKARSSRAPKLEAPKLTRVIFPALTSKIATDEHGTPKRQGGGKAYLELSIAIQCRLGNEGSPSQKSTPTPMAALTVEIEAHATNDAESDGFYDGSITAIGYVTFDEKLKRYELDSDPEIYEKYFKSSFDTIYAMAARELQRLIEITGLNPPPVPLSLDSKGMLEALQEK